MHTETTPAYLTPAIELSEREGLLSPIVWWVVLLITLLALALVLAVAVTIWCSIHGGGVVVRWTVNGWVGTVTIGCSK